VRFISGFRTLAEPLPNLAPIPSCPCGLAGGLTAAGFALRAPAAE
jgi:hypothetical protein